MHIDWWTLLFQTINFLILVWLLQRFLYRPVLAVIDRRRRETDSLVDAAKQARAEAETERQGLQTERQAMGTARDALLAEAKRDADEVRTKLVADARREVERLLADARVKIAQEREDAAADLRRHAATLAIGLAGHVLGEVAHDDLDDAFFDAAVASLGRLPPDEIASLRQAIAGADAGSPAVHVVSARPLDRDRQARYRDALAGLFGQAPAIGYAVDKDLIAGVEIHLPHTIIHHSARSTIDRAAQEIDDDNAASRS
jgi:F-type H+-transporting ATPase subunit b